MKHEGWALAEALGVELDGSSQRLLERFERLLYERALPMGMIATSDGSRLRERHIVDSLRAAPLLPDVGSVCDLGSGAGLPGVALAIARPDLRFTLVEVRRQRAAFLERVVADLGLGNAVVYPRRLETLRTRFSTCTARAFASATSTWDSALHLLSPDGYILYWAGSSFDPQRDTPVDASLRLFPAPALARSGPLVIMARQ